MNIIYKAAIGFNNIGGLVRLTTQPRCPGLAYPVWIPTSIGDEPNGKQLAKLMWDATSPEKLQAVLVQLGLNNAFNKAVTLTLPVNGNRALGFFNCYVSYPKRVEYLDWINDAEIDVRVVEQIA